MSWKRMLTRSRAWETSERSIAASMSTRIVYPMQRRIVIYARECAARSWPWIWNSERDISKQESRVTLSKTVRESDGGDIRR